MKKIIWLLVLFFWAVTIQPTWAGEIDVLLEKLVEKGVLSPMEASIVKDETKQQVKQDLSKRDSYALPQWVQNMKLKGDLRIRHQYERRKNDTEPRNRGRVRYRLQVQSQVTDQVKVVAGLASGSSDPRSTNQTFQNTFDTPDIRLDLAYAEYTPNSNVSIAVGKHERKPYLWAPTDMLWDGDINPEGGSAHIQKELFGDMIGFLNTGVWILDDNDQVDEPDPFLVFVQGGLETKKENVDAKVAVTSYTFQGIEDRTLDNSAGTNSLEGGASNLAFDFDSVGISAEVGLHNLLGGLPLSIDERIAVFGDFIHNMDGADQKNGWASGVKFGNAKIKEKGQWQGKYTYVWLGKDAFPDTFPDSDRYGGATDVKSHEFALEYALLKNIIFGVDYYYSNRIKGTDNPEH
ncbi:MAG: putative porin, partial [Candidatus Omnitrophica bacterium]|nr:putative porin [Candidatus Omnitrophota bacterium]